MMYLYGASGHAKVIIEILESLNIHVDGLFDDNKSLKNIWNYTVTSFPDDFDPATNEIIISIGSNAIRKKIAAALSCRYGTAIHPFTSVSSRMNVGEGTVVMAGVIINADVTIGKHCIVNTNASVDHDCKLEDYVHVSPNVALCGNVRVGEGTHIGAGAVVIPGINIGKWAVIGAGAVVIRDVPDGVTVIGNPAIGNKKKD